jgi:2-oxo-4-hydroxy-4-carboxy-5-ureidoimidazoline decarboxylase
MSDVLSRWNFLPAAAASNEILPCCGSRTWASGVAARRPLETEAALLAASDEIWHSLLESDWLEAFRSHPRIGDSRAPQAASPQSAAWSEQEQRSVAQGDEAVRLALAEANRQYELRFNRIFIVCATGKVPEAILDILQRRLSNDERTELLEAAEQQRQITQIRLRKWLHRSQETRTTMAHISTHILDIAQGQPARNVPVRLEKRDATGSWRLLASARTDQDGRCSELLPDKEQLTPGLYRLGFETATYFATLKLEGLYPLVEITFQVRNVRQHFHIPLLLSANGYTTYRGS